MLFFSQFFVYIHVCMYTTCMSVCNFDMRSLLLVIRVCCWSSIHVTKGRDTAAQWLFVQIMCIDVKKMTRVVMAMDSGSSSQFLSWCYHHRWTCMQDKQLLWIVLSFFLGCEADLFSDHWKSLYVYKSWTTIWPLVACWTVRLSKQWTVRVWWNYRQLCAIIYDRTLHVFVV